jgi:hypothetical protein
VRRIFHLFVVDQQPDSKIARLLNRERVTNQHGRPWTADMVHRILGNENYVGNLVHNRTSRRLGQKQVRNPDNLWIRRERIIDPIVDPKIFARAQKIMGDRYVSITEEQMLVRLRITLAKKGELTSSIINNTPSLPSTSSYTKHFGSLRKAFDLIGYTSPRDCDWIDTREILVQGSDRTCDANG